METVVYSVLVPTTQVVERNIGTTIQNDTNTISSSTNTTFVTLPAESTILVEVESGQVLLAGQAGPKGQNAEDVDMYSKRVDFVNDNLLYKGEAAVGSSESSAVWRIRRIVIGSDSDVTETWASGTASFDKVWADRTSLTYI